MPLVINALVLNQKLTLLTLLKPTPTPIVTIALIVAPYLPSTLTATQKIYAGRSALVDVLLVADSLNNVQHLPSLIQKSDYYPSRSSYKQSYYLLSYLYTYEALQRLTNPVTAMLVTASISCTYLSIKTVDLLVIPASATQYSTPRYVFKPRTYYDSLLSSIPSTKILLQRIFELYSRYLITPRLVGSLTRLYALRRYYVVYPPIILV